MGWLSKILGKKEDPANIEFSAKITVDDGLKPRGEVEYALHSGDLNLMLAVTGNKADPVNRHFLLMGIVDETYKRRAEKTYKGLFYRHAKIHLKEMPILLPHISGARDDPNSKPQVSTYQKYATVLTEDGHYDEAIKVCQKAIALGFLDSAKSGYEGRIERIKKKALQAHGVRPP